MEHDVKQIWDEFWLPIVRADDEQDFARGVSYDSGPHVGDYCVQTEDGIKISLDQVAHELADYRTWMTNWSQLMQFISGGKLSKINYSYQTMYDALQEYIDECIADARAEWEEERELV